MTTTSTSIHTDKPLRLKYEYLGRSDTALLSVIDADFVEHAHCNIFMDGVYADRLERAVAAFNAIIHAPDAAEAA